MQISPSEDNQGDKRFDQDIEYYSIELFDQISAAFEDFMGKYIQGLLEESGEDVFVENYLDMSENDLPINSADNNKFDKLIDKLAVLVQGISIYGLNYFYYESDTENPLPQVLDLRKLHPRLAELNPFQPDFAQVRYFQDNEETDLMIESPIDYIEDIKDPLSDCSGEGFVKKAIFESGAWNIGPDEDEPDDDEIDVSGPSLEVGEHLLGIKKYFRSMYQNESIHIEDEIIETIIGKSILRFINDRIIENDQKESRDYFVEFIVRVLISNYMNDQAEE